jgi:hypothetical protein
VRTRRTATSERDRTASCCPPAAHSALRLGGVGAPYHSGGRIKVGARLGLCGAWREAASQRQLWGHCPWLRARARTTAASAGPRESVCATPESYTATSTTLRRSGNAFAHCGRCRLHGSGTQSTLRSARPERAKGGPGGPGPPLGRRRRWPPKRPLRSARGFDQSCGVVAAPATAPVPPPTAAPTAAPGAHPIGSVTIHPIAAPIPAPAAPPARARAPGSACQSPLRS